MSYQKRIICLANSRKNSGRCIAGIEVGRGNTLGGWIRPVSARVTQELSEDERRYQNGADPRVMDIIEIPFLEAVPHAHQVENHLIDGQYYWEKVGTAGWDVLQAAVQDGPGTLWENGDSTQIGINDRMSQEAAEEFDYSLLLIEPEDLTILVRTEGVGFGNPRRRVRARFEWKGEPYLLSVTDPVAERNYLRMDNGEYRLGEALLCVSVGEPFSDGRCYKFCATVITPRTIGN